MKNMKFERQVLTQLTGTVLLMSSQWMISVLLIRLGGFADAGIFSLAMSMASVFYAIADCGIRNYYISDTKGEFSRSQYVLTRLCAVLLSFLVCGGYLLLESGAYAVQEQLAILIWLTYLNINGVSDIHFGALQLREKLYVNGASNALRGALGIIVFLSVYILTHNLTLTLCAIALNVFTILVLYDLWQYHKEFGRPVLPHKRDFFAVVQIMQKCFPLMLGSILGLLFSAIPRRTINVLLGNVQLGYFSSTFAPASLISTLGTSALSPFVPKLSEKWKSNDTKAFLKIVGGAYGGTAAFMALAEIAAVLVGRPVMRFVFGEEVMPYYRILYLAILSYGLTTMSYCGYCVMLAIRRIKTYTMIAVVAVLFMACVTGGLIEKMGIMGAAVALIGAYLIQCAAHLAVTFIELIRRNKDEQS